MILFATALRISYDESFMKYKQKLLSLEKDNFKLNYAMYTENYFRIFSVGNNSKYRQTHTHIKSINIRISFNKSNHPNGGCFIKIKHKQSQSFAIS